MALVVGLDIGDRTLTGAVFSGKPGSFRLVDFFVEEIPRVGEASDENGDGELSTPLSLAEVLQKALRARNLKAADVIAAVDTKDCVIREIPVPFTRDDQIRKTVYFEAEGHYTGFDLDEAVLEYIKVGESGNKSHLVVIALRHECIAKRLGLLKECGLDPLALDLDSAALFNAFALTPTFDPERTTLLVDMGASATKILLIEGGKLKKMRALRLATVPATSDRMIPEPAAVGAGSTTEVAVEVVGGAGDVPAAFTDYSIESRFQEIENALRRLDPVSGGGDGGELPSAPTESTESAKDDPIAIITDEEYVLIQDDLGENDNRDESGDVRLDQELDITDLDVESGGGSAPRLAERGPEKAETASYQHRFPGSANNGNRFDYRNYLERISSEIHRSLASSDLSSNVELICLTGGMSHREEARRFLTEEFDVETIDLDFGDFLAVDADVDADEVGRLGAVAVGLALKQYQRDQVGLDFRKGPFRFEHRFEKIRFPLLVASALFLVLFLQAFFWSWRDFQQESQRLAKYQAHSAATFEAFFETQPKGNVHPTEAAKRQMREWEGKGSGQKDRFLDPAGAMRNFADVMNASKFHFEISQLDFKFRLKPPRAAAKGARRSSSSGLHKAERSKVVFTTDESVKFRLVPLFNSDSRSKFFDATASEQSSGSKGGYKVSLDLSVKDSKLREYR